MAYTLFANNLVDYAPVYRGMRSVVLNGLEAFADVTLTTDTHSGKHTVPPHFIDSVAHLAGFVMNVSDALDTSAKFAVTPGWKSMRFAKELVPGGKYRSYVEMIPTKEDPSVYLGDVYVLQGAEIVGMVGGITFRRYPRILLGRFFSAPDDGKAPPVASAAATAHGAGTVVKKAVQPAENLKENKTVAASAVAPAQAQAPKAEQAVASSSKNAGGGGSGDVKGSSQPGVGGTTAADDATSTTGKAIQIIASEAALDLADLTDDASFNELGVDSLMSLVIAEKFREQLGVVVNGSLFLEYPTIGDLRSWLNEYYS